MKNYLIIAITLCATMPACAQSNSFSFQYSMASGTGDLGEFNNKSSFRGATIEWRKYIQPKVALGFELGWNAWYNERATDTYTSGNASLTGKQFRYQNEFPILIAANYYLDAEANFQPFFGLGLGTMFSRRDLDMHVYTLRQEAWHFAIRPEAGFLLKIHTELSAYVAFKYYNGLQSGDLTANQSYITLNLGLVFIK